MASEIECQRRSAANASTFGVRSRWSLAVFAARPLVVLFAACNASSPPFRPPSTVTKASNPQLPNHLIRELMHTIRLKGSGDAMVLLALSGKDPFSVFKYVVENHVYASTGHNGISLRSGSSVYFKFVTEGSKLLVIRFVRELYMYEIPSMPLPFVNIIKLTIFGGVNKAFFPIFHSFTDVEVLKLDFYVYPFDLFFNEVGNLSLTHLRKLDIRLTLNDLLKLLSTTSSFLLPEDVTFQYEIIKSVPDLGPLQEFPNVKHLEMFIDVEIPMTATMLHHISTVISCFTGLETAKIEFSYDHYAYKNDFAEVVEFHEWLRNTNFSFPVEVDVDESAKLAYAETPKMIYEQLKSIGYEEDGVPTNFILKKEYGNVKLSHQIKYFDQYRFYDTDDNY